MSKCKYKMVADKIIEQVMCNELVSGQKLPSIRDGAILYDMSVISVLNAYKYLVEIGVVESAIGIGYFISNNWKEALSEKYRIDILDLVRKCITLSKNIYISEEELIKIIHSEWKSEKS